MKRVHVYLFSAVLTFILALSLVSTAYAATYTYAVDGGNLYFDPITGTITDCDSSVFTANIPSHIMGIPVTEIGAEAFAYCSKLVRVNIPDTVTTIKPAAFACCDALKYIEIPSSVTQWWYYKNSGFGMFEQCRSLETIRIPKRLGSIPKNTFKDCTSLRNVEIAEGITSIGKEAFHGCSNLYTITIPDSVKNIGDTIFYDCTNLTTVTLGKGIEYVCKDAFYNCPYLKSIYFRGNAPGTGGSITNKYSSNFAIYYPQDASGWTTPTWNGFVSRPYSPTVTVRFDANGGSVSPASKTYKFRAPLGTLPTPTRTGYQFDGWYTSSGQHATANNTVTGDMTLYAHWTKNPIKTYTITLNGNGGTASKPSITVESGKTYLNALPTPTRTGWKFVGWYTAKTGGTKITAATKATANRTVYAHWTRNRTYMVTFDPNGGSVYEEAKFVYQGATYKALPTPTRSGYHFKGWYTKRSGGMKVTETSRVNLSGNQTLYAQWQTASVTARSTQSGSWRVSIPAYWEFALYGSATAPKASGYAAEKSTYQTISCTKKATLSNGTIRYFGKVNNKSVWFTYSCEMDVK